MFIWQLVSAPSIGHHQAIVQEHECMWKLNTVQWESELCVTETSLCIVSDAPTGMLHEMITF
jgi:hypothetical protein